MMGVLSGAASKDTGALGLTPQEKVEIDEVLSGARRELSPDLRLAREQRLEAVRGTSMTGLAWCSRCTRVHAGEQAVGGYLIRWLDL